MQKTFGVILTRHLPPRHGALTRGAQNQTSLVGKLLFQGVTVFFRLLLFCPHGGLNALFGKQRPMTTALNDAAGFKH